MTYQLGIDLGTTYTAAAICRGTDRAPAGADVVTLGTRSPTVASVLYLADDGSILVGEAAERRALTDPDRVVREFKRRIGDDVPLMIAGRPHQAHELAARMVRWVVDQVTEREGGPPRRIAITHPAAWGQHKKDLLSRALGTVGLTVTFLAEPQAAAVSYASAERVESGSTIAVYDLGGGTFDAAVVRKTGTGAGFELLGQPEGIERLGGVDFDEVVFGHVREGLGSAFDELDPDDKDVLSAVARLRRECVDAKEALSSDTEATIPVLLPELRTQVRLTRGEFESMIRSALEETVGALRRAVGSAGLTPEDLTAVLLVGGSSRIPLVSQLVSDELGRPVAVDADPKTAIALGAALAISPQQQQQPQRAAGLPIPQADLGGGPGGRPGPGGPGRGMGPGLGAAAGAGVAGYLANSPNVSPASQQGPLGGGQGGGGQGGGGQGGNRGPSGPPPSAPPRPPARQSPPPPPPQNRPAAFAERAAPARPAMDYQRPEFQEQNGYADEQRRKQTTLLIGVGGVVAIVVIVAAIFLWPKASDADSTSSTSDLTPEETTSAPPATHSSSGSTKTTPRTTPRTTPKTTPPTTPKPTTSEAPSTTGATTGSTTTPSTTGATTGSTTTPSTTGSTTGSTTTPSTTGSTTGSTTTPSTTGTPSGSTTTTPSTGSTTTSPSGATSGTNSGSTSDGSSTGGATNGAASSTGSGTGSTSSAAPSSSGASSRTASGAPSDTSGAQNGLSNGLQGAPQQRPAPAVSNQPVSQAPSDPPTGATMLMTPRNPTSNSL